jgi:hypothetical protein
MATLARELRKELEKTVAKARNELEVDTSKGESAAGKALKEYAVHEVKPYDFMDKQRQELREDLRARGLQAGDIRGKDGSQTLRHLSSEFAYEHWHRMLFARFLAENQLLIPPGQEPGKEMAISLEECRELAKDENKDWLTLASEYAQRMLPAIFRPDDPVLDLSLPMESRGKLESWLKELPTAVFLADDSLGWVYQFWQANEKERVNKSGVKIGADEIAPVTQLFTEDYMVLFLLHNTLGAWWAAKKKAEGKSHELPGYEWTYLRFADDGAPAAGAFEGWPTLARDLKVLDPCMGSGHFLVFALPILVGFRMQEEGLSKRDAISAVLRDNLFGLEIDPRCTQIAAFNLALTAWKMGEGHFQLPQLNLACSGLGIHAKEEDWVKLAGKDSLLRETMEELYQLFKQAPVLGSLIDPKRVGGHLFAANFEKARPLLEQALTAEHKDIAERELAVVAAGLLSATRILSENFTLVATNVPYLSRSKQDDQLRQFCDSHFSRAKNDLATCFVEHTLSFCRNGGTTALVVTSMWLMLGRYKKMRENILKEVSLRIIAPLGPGAFETISGEVVNVTLAISNRHRPIQSHEFLGIDAAIKSGVSQKQAQLISGSPLAFVQSDQLKNPDARILLQAQGSGELLLASAESRYGLRTGDLERCARFWWELDQIGSRWRPLQGTVDTTTLYGGRERVLLWENGGGPLRELADLGIASIQGEEAWGRTGIAVSLMSSLPVTIYTGEVYDNGTGVIWPRKPEDLAAIFRFCSSREFNQLVRKIDFSIKVTNQTLLKVPFDGFEWNLRALETYPEGLPRPHSDDPTQWLFDGGLCKAEQVVQVGVARLLGYRWPRQTGSSFPDCPALGKDELEGFATDDGIVCLSALQDEQTAANRLSALLAAAYGDEWPGNQQALLNQAGAKSPTIEDWLRDEFFAQHCDLFHNRPFIWHISDGLDQGFHALVNYHKLAEANGGGRRTLDKLTYTYLGDWIDRQRSHQKQGVAGSDARLASAVHLQDELKKILSGEKPYDIFVRWKPLDKQAIGWEPDIDDGVRMNIRPFINARPLAGKGKNLCILRGRPGTSLKWTKDKGIEPHREKQDFPWFWTWDEESEDFAGGDKFDGNRWNDLHYSLELKKKARVQHDAKTAKGQKT